MPDPVLLDGRHVEGWGAGGGAGSVNPLREGEQRGGERAREAMMRERGMKNEMEGMRELRKKMRMEQKREHDRCRGRER